MYSVKRCVTLSLTLLVVVLAARIPVTSAQNNLSDNSSGIVQELRDIRSLLERESSPFSWSSLLTLSSIVATVSVAYFIFWLDQRSRRKSIIRRACMTLERELTQAIESFESGKRIRGSYYRESLGQDPILRSVNYSSEMIIIDSYESILHSGFFTELHTETQNFVSTVYDRIRTRNRLLLAIGELKEQTPKMFEDQGYLTEQEPKIITLLHHSLERVRSEMTYSIWSRLKKTLQLKGNPDS